MTFDYIEFENGIIEKLKQSNLIERFSENELHQTPDIGVIIKAFDEPSLIEFDDDGLFFYDENNNKIYCPKMLTSISDRGEWLSDKIPFVEFDIDQNGNVRKADEAEALFCCICVSNILKEKSMKEEVLDLSKNYDFENMKPISIGSLTFRMLLNEWQGLQSVVINILIAACKYRIQDVKKDIEKFLKDGLSSTQAAELREIESKVRSINFKFSEGKLSPDNVKTLTKIERLKLIDERDDEITSVIKSSKYGTLYKLTRLSSEYISPVKKKRIFNWVRKEVDNLLSNMKDNENVIAERSQLISRLSRRAIRFEKNSIRRLNIEKFIADKENFKFPSKL